MLNQVASASSSVYRIVFTGLLIVELVKYQLRRRSNGQAAAYRDSDRCR